MYLRLFLSFLGTLLPFAPHNNEQLSEIVSRAEEAHRISQLSRLCSQKQSNHAAIAEQRITLIVPAIMFVATRQGAKSECARTFLLCIRYYLLNSDALALSTETFRLPSSFHREAHDTRNSAHCASQTRTHFVGGYASSSGGRSVTMIKMVPKTQRKQRKRKCLQSGRG